VRLRVEVEGEPDLPSLPNEGANLVAFMSFAIARGFGAQHPLVALAEHLHRGLRVPLGPLETFYEGVVEDEEDAERLERAWQPAEPLRATLAALAAALRDDPTARRLLERAGTPALAEEAERLAALLEGPACRRKNVRLSYFL